MQTKFYCSVCGFSLKVKSVADYSVPNFVELRIIIEPCSECAAQQTLALDSATPCHNCTSTHEHVICSVCGAVKPPSK